MRFTTDYKVNIMKKTKKKLTDIFKNEKSKTLLIAAVVLVVGLVAIFFLTNGFNIDSVYSQQENSTSFPISFTSNDIIDVKSIDSRLFVLSKKLVTCVDSKGTTKFDIKFNFSDPAIFVGRKYGIVYDRMSDKYLVFSKKELIREAVVPGESSIYSAIINDSGEVLVSTKSNDSSSNLYLINKDGKKELGWSCAEEYIISLDFNSKSILCGAIGSYNGEIYTKTYVIDKKTQQVKREYTLSDSLLLDVTLNGSKAIVTCQNKRLVYDIDKEIEGDIVNFSSAVKHFAEDTNGNIALLSNISENSGDYSLSVFNKNNELVYSQGLDFSVADVICEQQGVYILTDNRVVQIAKDGTSKGDLTFEKSNFGIVKANRNIYCYNLGGVEKAEF